MFKLKMTIWTTAPKCWSKYTTDKAGKSLYRGKVHYPLCSCQSTLSSAAGKEEKMCLSKQLIKNLIDNCTSESASSPLIEISLEEVIEFQWLTI